MNEIWKDIPGYEGYYQVSNLGNIKALARVVKARANSVLTFKEKPIKIFTYKNLKYQYVALSKDGKMKKFKFHRVIATAFIPNPNNYPFINHINAIRDDNRIENLEWCTHSHNMKHKFITGNANHYGAGNPFAKGILNLQTGIYYDTVTDAAIAHNIGRHSISDPIRRPGKRIHNFIYI